MSRNRLNNFVIYLFALIAVVFGGSYACAAQVQRAITSGNARFQVLTPTLVRMEYSPTAKFEDAPSVVVINRSNWPEAVVKTSEKDGWLELATDKLILRYKIGSGGFGADNLTVTWQDNVGKHDWKPGDKDDKNLGGVISWDMSWIETPPTNPGLLSRAGYTLFDDSHTPVWQDSTKWIAPRSNKDGQDLYFFVYGANYPHFLQEYVELTGPIPLLPRWSLGTGFTSRLGYSADEVKKTAWRFRDEGIPLDMMVMDSCTSAKAIWYGYDFDLEQMPDPKGFFDWMNRNGFHVGRNEHYEALPKSDSHFEVMRQAMGLPANTGAFKYDMSKQKCAQAFTELLQKPVLDMGLGFWWLDGNPESSMEGLDRTMWSRKIEFEGTEKTTGKRAFIMSRHGSWGSHRYPAFFTGDVLAQWNMLAYEVPFTVQGGNVLEAYITNDISGFTYPNLSPEMYIRWMQFGCFSPIMRLHSIYGMRMPWEYGDIGYDQVKKFFKLRYALLPYIYTYARVAHETGQPLVRGMYLDYPDQEDSYRLKEQYMFGKQLLVAPVVEPGHGQSVLKDVFLPKGDDWYDYFTGKIYRGGQVLPYEYPLERMPIFVRAGSIIPMAPEMNYTSEKPVDPLTLDIYAGKPAEFRLYEDDGTSFDYRKGACAFTRISLEPSVKPGDYTIAVGPTKGSFVGQLKKRRYEIRLHGLLNPNSVKLNGTNLPKLDQTQYGSGWRFDRKSGITSITLAEPLETNKGLVLSINGAGTFADALVLQKTIDFRDRVRRVKHEEKIKLIAVSNLGDNTKMAKVIRETESIEWKLDDIISSPKGIASNPPDYRAMTASILEAFVDQPFDTTRSIPYNDKTVDDTKALMDKASFTPMEIDNMTSILLDVKILARVEWDEKKIQSNSWDNNLRVLAQVTYDTDAVGPAKAGVQLQPPTGVLPGWSVGGPDNAADGYTLFPIREMGGDSGSVYPMRLKADLSWDKGRTEVWRDIEWRK